MVVLVEERLDRTGAFLAGQVVAGTAVAHRVERLVLPLRDLFAAMFFFAFGLSVDPGALTTAAGITALTVLGMAALGYAMSKDVSGWMRPLSLIVLGAVAVSLNEGAAEVTRNLAGTGRDLMDALARNDRAHLVTTRPVADLIERTVQRRGGADQHA